MPPTVQTNELVHKYLLIGKNNPHNRPTTNKQPPATNIYPTFFVSLNPSLRSFINSPVNIPNKAVPIAGKVDKIPSGS